MNTNRKEIGRMRRKIVSKKLLNLFLDKISMMPELEEAYAAAVFGNAA